MKRHLIHLLAEDSCSLIITTVLKIKKTNKTQTYLTSETSYDLVTIQLHIILHDFEMKYCVGCRLKYTRRHVPRADFLGRKA